MDQRENFKIEMIKKRESGDLEAALKGFDEILEWDKNNGNDKGYIDVLGHKRIVCSHMAERSQNPDEKRVFIEKALEIAGTAISSAEQKFPDDKGLRSILNAHLADVLIVYSEFAKDKMAVLKQAYNVIDESLKDLSGSKAHMAWVLNKKAQVEYLLGNMDGALSCLKTGEIMIFNGYDEELKNSPSDGLLKIKVWLTGLWLTFADIYKKEGRTEMARFYAQAVKNFEDPEGTLKLRKQQAERILGG